MLWWKCGHYQVVSYEAQVHQSLISEINIEKLKSFATRKIEYFELRIFLLTHMFTISYS